MAGRAGHLRPVATAGLVALSAAAGLAMLAWAVSDAEPAEKRGGKWFSAEELARLAFDVGWSGEDLVTAVAVAIAESGGFTGAVNVNVHQDGESSVDRGLFQLNSRHHPKVSDAEAFDPVKNAAYAWSLWMEQGFLPWMAFKNGSYRRFLLRARAAGKRAGVL